MDRPQPCARSRLTTSTNHLQMTVLLAAHTAESPAIAQAQGCYSTSNALRTSFDSAERRCARCCIPGAKEEHSRPDDGRPDGHGACGAGP